MPTLEDIPYILAQELKQDSEHAWWEGELSSSALSTATAILALRLEEEQAGNHHGHAIQQGKQWLLDAQNADGGWGDTDQSFSNISTTLLAHSALTYLGEEESDALIKSQAWIEAHAGSMHPEDLKNCILKRYGKDRTFSVPILMTCAIGGLLGKDQEAWAQVLPLPFELATFPRQSFGALGLPVVSYALPALIAIGQARHYHAPMGGIAAPLRAIKQASIAPTSKLLAAIQPSSGGYLEATPLTSFVLMALLSSANVRPQILDCPHLTQVIAKGKSFLLDSQRPDGSWPIDTHLRTWVTTLAIKSYGAQRLKKHFETPTRLKLLHFLLDTQYRETHPFTDSAPGGWAWTPLSGGVPDGDDTAGALLALYELEQSLPELDLSTKERIAKAVEQGCQWLLQLQNRDGGVPTFCRGWGKLPFDRSSPDITAHALRAWSTWQSKLPTLHTELTPAIHSALQYLIRAQNPDGSWTPLWFGDQHHPSEANHTYGTSMVLQSLANLDTQSPKLKTTIQKGLQWLTQAQQKDGTWGGNTTKTSQPSPSSIEESSLALQTLQSYQAHQHPNLSKTCIKKGRQGLKNLITQNPSLTPSPIGFYFAKLWYHEKLYPKSFLNNIITKDLRR